MWTRSSWRQFPALQQPLYADREALSRVVEHIRTARPLVSVHEIEALKRALSDAADGHGFLLQGGDCAERFQDASPHMVESKLRILQQVGQVLAHAMGKPVIQVGRMAGQYAKPRTMETEWVDGQEIPSFRGDNVNGIQATWDHRQPDPRRLWLGHQHAHRTLEYMRACASSQAVYTSHEGLLLAYEEAMTYDVPAWNQTYNLGAHFLWIGDRTRHRDGAHVEFFRGIANPIGIKVGPHMSPWELVHLLEVLNPQREKGRISLITRLGYQQVGSLLPSLIHAVEETGHPVLWVCDPMHGNGILTESGIKTRTFSSIHADLEWTLAVHRQCGTHLGGLHIELTGERVTECLGGSEEVTPFDLTRNYQTYCDPRLNRLQSLELASLLAHRFMEVRLDRSLRPTVLYP